MKKSKFVIILIVFLLNYVYSNAQCVSFSQIQNDIGIESETFGASLADFNGDGYKDVVAIHAYNDIEVYFNNGTGDGTFDTTVHHYGDNSRWRFGVTTLDIDNDGDMDFLTVPFSNETWGIEVWKNDGSGNFTLIQDNIGTHTRGEELVVGDLDNDGDLDIFYPSQNEIQIFLNDGTGYFESNNQGEIVISSGNDAALADFDGDGDLDAAISANIGSAKEIYINDGNGNFVNSGQELTTTDTKGVDAGDIDNDGDIDIIYACPYDELEIWVNDGLGNFMPSGMDLTGLSSMASEVVAVDLNFDGNIDLVTTEKVLINDIPNSGTFISVASLGGSHHDVAVGDVNNDGFCDIYSPYFGSSSGDKVYLFNTASVTFNDMDETLCFGDSLQIAGVWQTEPGVYIENDDCYAYNRINLSFYDEINTNVTLEDGVLTAEATGINYQWINCEDNQPINGEINQTFTPTESGNYAVVLSNVNCSVTSDCIEVDVANTFNVDFNVTDEDLNPISEAGITVNYVDYTTDANGFLEVQLADGTYNYYASATGYVDYLGSLTVAGEAVNVDVTLTSDGSSINDINSNISVYPNPTTGIFRLANVPALGSVKITDITGKTIYTTIGHVPLQIDISNQPAGIYFIKIQTENKIIIKKLIKG